MPLTPFIPWFILSFCFCLRYTLLSEGSLRVYGVQLSDAGRYYCTVSNQAGSAHRGVDLRVFGDYHTCSSAQAAEVLFTLPLQRSNIPSGEILLRFRRDMNYCPPSDEIGSMCTFKVWIEAMIIVCFIQFLSFLLCVHAFGFLSVGPSISPGQFNVTVTAGMRAVLSCETTGIPPPKVSWKRNGKPLDASQLSGAFRCLSIYKDLIYVRA